MIDNILGFTSPQIYKCVPLAFSWKTLHLHFKARPDIQTVTAVARIPHEEVHEKPRPRQEERHERFVLNGEPVPGATEGFNVISSATLSRKTRY